MADQGNFTAMQALQQSRDFQDAADDIADFHLKHFETLSKEEVQELNDHELELRSKARQLLHDAAQITWDDLQATLGNIRNATEKMRSVQSHLTSVKRVLSFATAGITLAAAILSADPLGVAQAGIGVVDLVEKFRKADDAAHKAEGEAVGKGGEKEGEGNKG